MSWDLAVEQVLPLHTTLTLSYVANRGTRLPVFVDSNVDPSTAVLRSYFYIPAPGAAPQVIQLPYYPTRLSPNSGAILTGFSDVNSNYHSFVATVRKPLAHGVEVLANYTWARATDGGQVSGVNGTFMAPIHRSIHSPAASALVAQASTPAPTSMSVVALSAPSSPPQASIG